MVVFRPDENIKVCSVLAYRAEPLQSVPEHQRTQGPARSVTVLGRQEAQCPPSDWLIPACGAAFSLDDLHATSRRSSGRRFTTAEHLPVRRNSRLRINTQRATSQTESPADFRPTAEPLTRGAKSDVTIIFSSSWLRQEERTQVEVAELTVNDCA